MATSQNGWPVFTSSSHGLRAWVIPGTGRTITLRDGSAGFLLAHLALWFHDTIERIDGGVWDDWGYAYRTVRGQTTGFSNHASGTATDLNSTRHPLGKRGTFKRWQVIKIHARLKLVYLGLIRWGGDYQYRADEMHWEINNDLAKVERRARKLSGTPRGKRILAANPGARRVIFS